MPAIPIRLASVQGHFTLRETAERAAGLGLLVLASPLLLASSVLIVSLSRRSPLVAHLRAGKHNQPFWMLKLRTMWPSGGSIPRQPGWIEYVVAEPPEDGKAPSDPRVSSRFAAFCRRHSIDELPQFWHVFTGRMSLVGPRPLTAAELDRHYGSRKQELLSVKPGLTGLWQVSGRSAIKFPHRATLDLRLVRELGPRLYCSILARTLWALIAGQGAW